MIWNVYYLKTADFDELLAAFPTAWRSLEGGPLEASIDHALDCIGTLYSLDGLPIEGYHANLRIRADADIPESLQPYFIDTPAFPKRVFA